MTFATAEDAYCDELSSLIDRFVIEKCQHPFRMSLAAVRTTLLAKTAEYTPDADKLAAA